MANRSKKALNAWIDENIKDQIEYAYGHMASLKGAYYLSAYLFLGYACTSRSERVNNGYDYIMALGSKNESLQEIYLKIAKGLSDMANFDFIMTPKKTHELVKTLLNQTEAEADKYDYDEACDYLIKQFYMRTSKMIGGNWENIAAWVIADKFAPREERINFIKNIK